MYSTQEQSILDHEFGRGQALLGSLVIAGTYAAESGVRAGCSSVCALASIPSEK